MLKKTLPTVDPSLTLPLFDDYQRHLIEHEWRYDPAQYHVLHALAQLLEQITALLNYQQHSPLQRLRLQKPECTPLYLHGEVGAGKSWLMNLFYQHCPFSQKRRVHFNVFILEVHRFIHQWQNSKTDPFTAFARQLRQELILLCFDEFQLMDIADAMILGRLFKCLFAEGIIIVITSNRHPSQLYQGGVQREQLHTFVQLLTENMQFINVDALEDYRLLNEGRGQNSYVFPLNESAEQFIQHNYQQLTQQEKLKTQIFAFASKQLTAIAIHQRVLWCSFHELCGQALSAIDYLHLIEHFDTVLLTAIPQLRSNHRNEARRFITLIDIFYEHGIYLICSAEVPAPALYIEGDGCFEFKRTVSRLIEMQSSAYRQKHQQKYRVELCH